MDEGLISSVAAPLALAIRNQALVVPGRDRHRAIGRRPRDSPAGGVRVRVIIAEDEVLLREGIARILAEEDYEVVGLAGDRDELIGMVRAHRPDLVVTDIRMPPTFHRPGRLEYCCRDNVVPSALPHQKTFSYRRDCPGFRIVSMAGVPSPWIENAVQCDDMA